jgi:hypothetical protein
MLSAARLLPFAKKTGGVRPIAVGETLRRLTSKLVVGKHQKKIVSKLLPNQLGVGIPGATEFIYKGVEQLLARNTPESDPLCLLQLDFSNAFDRLNRFEMRREVRRMAPEISPWVEYTYSVSAQLIVDHNNNVLSKARVQQGGPLAPLLF